MKAIRMIRSDNFKTNGNATHTVFVCNLTPSFLSKNFIHVYEFGVARVSHTMITHEHYIHDPCKVT